MQRETVLLSMLYMLVHPRVMKGSEDADYGWQPCYEWDGDADTWTTNSLLSVYVEDAPNKSGFKNLVTLTMQYDSNLFYYYGYCDQNLWFNFMVEWTVSSSEDDGNYKFYYTEGTYNEETKECELGYANEASTPLVSGEEYVLRNEKKKKGACGINIYLDYEDSASNLASSTEVLIYTNEAIQTTISAFALLTLTYLF